MTNRDDCQKDWLRLNKMTRDLHAMKHNYRIGSKERDKIENSIANLEWIKDELRIKIEDTTPLYKGHNPTSTIEIKEKVDKAPSNRSNDPLEW